MAEAQTEDEDEIEDEDDVGFLTLPGLLVVLRVLCVLCGKSHCRNPLPPLPFPPEAGKLRVLRVSVFLLAVLRELRGLSFMLVRLIGPGVLT